MHDEFRVRYGRDDFGVHIRFHMNVRRKLAFVLLIFSAALLPTLDAQTALPIAFNPAGFTGDIVLAASESSSSQANPGHNVSVSGWNFYEAGALSSLGTLNQGLPAASRLFTSAANANVQFQFASYTGPNVLLNAGTLALSSPQSYRDLHFLVTGQGGGANGFFSVTLNFSDATSTVASGFTGLHDWTEPSNGGTGLTGFTALSDMGLLSTRIYGATGSEHLYLTQFDYGLLPADQTKTLESITIGNIGGGLNTLMFFGASGTASAIPEPSTHALIAGIAMLGIAAWRRQKRRSFFSRPAAAANDASGV